MESPEGLGHEQNETDKKILVVEKMKDAIDHLGRPASFLLFGSVGRGHYQPDSDIDSMVIFRDEDADIFVSDGFLGLLPFDSNTSGLFGDNDRADLQNKTIDFLRVKARSNNEDVEFQLFPLSSIRKAAGIFSAEIIAGTKRADDNYKISDSVQSRPTLNFKGDRVYFEKSPKLAAGGNRIDISEVGTKRDDPAWIRGLTLGKLMAPKIVSDQLGITEYLDFHVMRGVIRALLYNLDLYVTDDTGEIIGIKRQALDYHILFNILHSHKTEDGTVENYQFGEDEEQNLKDRYDRQIADIIAKNGYEIF
jgi:hypothetical protein